MFSDDRHNKISSNFVSPFFGIVLKRLVSHFKYYPKCTKLYVKPMKGDNDHGKSQDDKYR